jgi:hypothetical protein
MTCQWEHPASENGDTARLCGKEGHPFCAEHQFIANVLEETESVTREIYAQRETALTTWQAEISRLSIFVERANDFTPAAFVKRIHELLPELRQAAMAAIVYTYVTSGLDEEGR